MSQRENCKNFSESQELNRTMAIYTVNNAGIAGRGRFPVLTVVPVARSEPEADLQGLDDILLPSSERNGISGS